MMTSKDLLLALLSMDSYNRGYKEGITGLSSTPNILLGSVKILKDANDPAGIAQSAGFYAIAYKTTSDIGDAAHGGIIPANTIIISYRGTDDKLDAMNDAMFISGVDVPPQALLAAIASTIAVSSTAARGAS